jgi:hypothetical protein
MEGGQRKGQEGEEMGKKGTGTLCLIRQTEGGLSADYLTAD